MSSFPVMPIVESAKWYAEKRGFHVYPVLGKAPLGRLVPNGHLGATNDVSTIESWWKRAPEAGIGISVRPSGLCVLDIDPRNGGDESFKELIEQHGVLPVGPHCLTGGGGDHYYFKSTPEISRSISGLLRGIDIKADGGVVAPPSPHVKSDRKYSWSVDQHIEEVSITPISDWLIVLISNHFKAKRSSTSSHSSLSDKVINGAKVGERNTTLSSVTGHLLQKNVDAQIVMELMLSWNKCKNSPPLSENEVARTVNSIAKAELKKRRGSTYDY